MPVFPTGRRPLSRAQIDALRQTDYTPGTGPLRNLPTGQARGPAVFGGGSTGGPSGGGTVSRLGSRVAASGAAQLPLSVSQAVGASFPRVASINLPGPGYNAPTVQDRNVPPSGDAPPPNLVSGGGESGTSTSDAAGGETTTPSGVQAVIDYLKSIPLWVIVGLAVVAIVIYLWRR